MYFVVFFHKGILNFSFALNQFQVKIFVFRVPTDFPSAGLFSDVVALVARIMYLHFQNKESAGTRKKSRAVIVSGIPRGTDNKTHHGGWNEAVWTGIINGAAWKGCLQDDPHSCAGLLGRNRFPSLGLTSSARNWARRRKRKPKQNETPSWLP